MVGSLLDSGNKQCTTDAKPLPRGVYILFEKVDNKSKHKYVPYKMIISCKNKCTAREG